MIFMLSIFQFETKCISFMYSFLQVAVYFNFFNLILFINKFPSAINAAKNIQFY